MGLVNADLKLSNPARDIQPLYVRSLVDTGAMNLCVPDMWRCSSASKSCTARSDNCRWQHALVPYVGPIAIEFENRGCRDGRTRAWR